jgi:hypothetical protein
MGKMRRRSAGSTMKTKPLRTAMSRPISEEPIIFGRVIAEREYRIGREKILLEIGTPHQASWKTDYYCPIRLVSKQQTKVRRAFGVDAIQALMLALAMTKAVLETTSSKIRWSAGDGPGDVGIYKQILSGLGSDFDRELERRIDKAILKRGQELKRQHDRRAARNRGREPK